MVLLQLDRELEVAIELARAAAAAILRHYAEDFAVSYKDSREQDPVTEADKEANRIIVEGLARAFPDDGILAEESVDSAARLGKRRLWCVDPLDGTREFVEKNGQFVVMIGLAIDGVAQLGVVLQPTENLLWHGIVGRGAFRVDGTGRHALSPSRQASPTGATMMASRSHPSKTVAKVAAALGIERSMPLGSVGLKVARVASGEADVYMSVSQSTKEWDACGPDAILTAAGGAMTDVRGRPLAYNQKDVHTPAGMLASNGRIHAACVAALAAAADAKGLP